MSPNSPLAIGTRTVLAMTCTHPKHQGDRLMPGYEFERYSRNHRDKHYYITRRCKRCRWHDLESHR